MKSYRNAPDETNDLIGMEGSQFSSFPFDHIYACRTSKPESVNGATATSHSAAEKTALQNLKRSQNENKHLKELMLAHLDLIQQQSDHLITKEKIIQTLKIENAQLKSKVKNLNQIVNVGRSNLNPPPLIHVPPKPQPAKLIETTTSFQPTLNYTDLLVTDIVPTGTDGAFICDSDLNKTSSCYIANPYDFTIMDETSISNWVRPTTDIDQNIQDQKATDKDVLSFKKIAPKVICTTTASTTTSTCANKPDTYNKMKGSRKPTSKFYKSRNAGSSLLKACSTGNILPVDDEDPVDSFTVNKKFTMIQTYSKSSKTVTAKKPRYMGSHSECSMTPTGEDPYQLGEADFLEQSPIPKMLLQSNTTKAKILNREVDTVPPKSTDSPYESIKIHETVLDKVELNKYNLGTSYLYPGENDDQTSKSDTEKCSESAKTGGTFEWQDNKTTDPYGKNTRSLTTNTLFENIRSESLFSDPYEPQTDNKSSQGLFGFENSKSVTRNKKKRGKSASSAGDELLSVAALAEIGSVKRSAETKRKKRSSLENRPSLGKKSDTQNTIAAILELAPLTVEKPFYTSVGSEESWYDSVTPECHEPAEPTESLEVPRWREKPYNSCYSLEGTENLDDEIFNKRHQKQEESERRRKRWDVQRLREQKHLERLRQRQREGPCYTKGYRYRTQSENSDTPPMHTFHPQPHLQAQYIELTETIPLSAFGEVIPALPKCDFVLPWIRVTKPFKRSKKSRLSRSLNKN